MKKYLIDIWRGERPLKDVWHFIVGHYRYTLYYSKFNFLIRKHIKEQIRFRIDNMNKECYNNGECIMCGCQTTALQMCSKPCEGKCYPPLYSKKMWNSLPESFKQIKRAI